MLEILTSVPVLLLVSALCFLIGGILLFRGYARRAERKGMARVTAVTALHGITWEWQGTHYHAVIPTGFFTPNKGRNLRIVVDYALPAYFKLNTWSQNGFLELFLSALSILLGFLSIVYLIMGL